MTTTTQVREWWAPACKAHTQSLEDAYVALDTMLIRHNYKPRAGVTGAFNCRPITGGTNYSLHAYDPDGFFTFWSGVRVTKAIAVDINWDTNPYGPELKTDMPPAMIEDIKKIKTRNGKQVFRWGGDYSGNKDGMHFEIIVSPADLATGVVIPEKIEPKPQPKEIPDMLIFHVTHGTANKADDQLYLAGGGKPVDITKFPDEFWKIAGAGVPVIGPVSPAFIKALIAGPS